MAKILLIEDDTHLAMNIKDLLAFERHTVDHAENGTLGLEFLKSASYDVIIIDWEVPEIKGIDVCQKFRYRGGKTPIIFLTGRDSWQDKETGLDAGADDYLTKPFHMKELSARLRALLRRPPMLNNGNLLKIGNIELDPISKKVSLNGEELHLPKSEYALLEFFMRNPNQLMTAETIIDRVWKTDATGSPETFRTCLRRLRAKIDEADRPSLIKNVHGHGYILELSPDKSETTE